MLSMADEGEWMAERDVGGRRRRKGIGIGGVTMAEGSK